MSLILDALKKAEADRKNGTDNPGLESNHGAINHAPQASSLLPWFAVGIAACIAIVILFSVIFFYLNNQQNQTTNSDQDIGTAINTEKNATANAAPSSVEQDSSIKSEANDQASKASSALALKQAMLARQQASSELIAAQYQQDEAAASSSTANLPSSNTDKDIHNLYADVPDTNTEQATKTRVKEKELHERNTNEALLETLAAYPAIKFVKSLSFSAQQEIPTLMYSEHNYAKTSPARVVINGKSLREGATLDGNIRVIKILSDGVILEKNNMQFKMQALNSWINF